jgi:hypothetical protein
VTTEPGVALGDYLRQDPGIGVMLWCNACAWHKRFDIPSVIAKLEAEGVDGRAFGIRALAARVAEPCPRCGKIDYETRPDFPSGAMGLSRE